MGTKLPRKLEQKMSVVGEQIKLDDDILWLAKEDKLGKALQDLSLKTRERASKKE